MRSSKAFFNWAFTTRAKAVMKIYNDEPMTPEKMFLSFCSHDPTFISHGPAGLNGSIKGIGFMPKPEYLEETLEAYIKHIKTYDPEDKTYSKRGLGVLIKYMYGEEARDRVDFEHIGSLEMAKKHSWANYKVNPEATLMFYQPPMISFEVRGTMHIYDEMESGKREIYQQFINAQHDMYHTPDMNRWLSYAAYVLDIEEIYDNSATKEGFGVQLEFPMPKE